MADKCIALCPRLDRATKGKKAVRKAADDFMCVVAPYERGTKKGRCANVTAEVLNSAAKVNALSGKSKIIAQAVSDHSYQAITKNCK